MTYEAKSIRRQKVLYNNANSRTPLTYQHIESGAKVTPTSATITVYAPGGSAALVGPVAMTLSGTLLTYSVVTTDTGDYPIDTGYRAEIAITIGGVVTTALIMFDVVTWILRLEVGKDQLIALDDGLNGIAHAGDSDLSEVIEACRDEIQVLIESRVLEDEKLIENMIPDHATISVAARPYILAQVWRNNGNVEKAKMYQERADKLLKSVLGSLRYDKGQTGEESATPGGLQPIRLVM